MSLTLALALTLVVMHHNPFIMLFSYASDDAWIINNTKMITNTFMHVLDTINSLLHHEKHVRGSPDIGFIAIIFAKQMYETASVSCRSQVVQGPTKVKMLLSDINL